MEELWYSIILKGTKLTLECFDSLLTPIFPVSSVVPCVKLLSNIEGYYDSDVKICLTCFQRLRDKVFASYQFIVSPVLPKLISPGPCPLTAVACSLNKGLVLVGETSVVYTTMVGPTTPVSCPRQLRDRNRGSVYWSKPVEQLLPITIDSNLDEPSAI